QRAEQVIGSPARVNCRQSLGGGQTPGQAPVLPVAMAGSQVSLGPSTAPLPHTAGQSLSRLWLPPGGQQPSSGANMVMGATMQRALQVAFDSSISVVQLLPSSQDCGHEPPIPCGMARSQVSLISTTPLPQVEE